MDHQLTTVLSGALVGLVLGLIGGGGSILAVPLLLYAVGVSSAHAAIGTSAVAVAIGALGNLIAVAQRGLVKWPCGLLLAASGIVGSYFGALLAMQLPGAKIIALFGGLMMVIATLMLLRKNAEGDPDVKLSFATARKMAPPIISSGLVAGTLAGFFGVGGGFLIVPALMFATGMTITNAIATSLVGITAFGAVTASTYMMAGEIDWPLLLPFVGGGVVGSLVGQFMNTKLANHKPLLQTLFAVAVMFVGIFTLYRGLP
jgi:uncharacterized protein